MASKFTDYAENKIADLFRGLPWTQSNNLYLGLASIADDVSSTELSGTGYARQIMPRAMATWNPTQGGTSPVVSSGTTHAITNANTITFPTAGSAWGMLNVVELWDALTGGNRLCYIPVTVGNVASGSNVTFAPGALSLTLGLTGGVSNYLANKLLDRFFRGVGWSWPATTYIAFCTSPPSNGSPGTEVPGFNGYGRIPIASSTTAWSGTQGAGTVGASTGTSGVISNNSPITFNTPSGDWGAITHDMQMDAPAGGNMLFYGQLTSPKTVLAGSAVPSYGSGNYQIIID